MNAPVKPPKGAGIIYHPQVVQGSAEWHAMRCGILTASEMKYIVTPTLKVASNEKERAHLYTLLSQRITGYVEPSYVGDDMLRGMEDEVDAKIAYQANYAPIEDCGFVTNDRFGFKIGYSPDALVGKEGLIEVKSRKHKFQVETILENVAAGTVPSDFLIQVQTGLLVTERKWCDFISYSAGLPMVTIRVHPIEAVQEAILDAATAFEIRMAQKIAEFSQIMKSDARLLATERRLEQEISL